MKITHPLSSGSLHKIFVQQLSILYGAKVHIIDVLPGFIAQATFPNLKHALTEDMEETKVQLSMVKDIFHRVGESQLTDACIAMDAVVAEAKLQVMYNANDLYASDMSLIFYMDIIEHVQIGACRILGVITQKEEFTSYRQAITECLNMNKDNAGLFKIMAEEYLGLLKS